MARPSMKPMNMSPMPLRCCTMIGCDGWYCGCGGWYCGGWDEPPDAGTKGGGGGAAAARRSSGVGRALLWAALASRLFDRADLAGAGAAPAAAGSAALPKEPNEDLAGAGGGAAAGAGAGAGAAGRDPNEPNDEPLPRLV